MPFFRAHPTHQAPLRLVLIPMLSFAVAAAAGDAKPEARFNIQSDQISFIDNGEIKVGVNRDLGGAITWLSTPGHDNLINNSDWGRQIQLSFYSGPQPFEPEGKKNHEHWKNWAWNPIQSGDVFGHRAKVVELTNTGTSIHLASIPMQWALDDVPGDCRFEADLKLEGPMLRVHYRLINQRTDHTWYAAHNQELPAVYLVSALDRLMAYTGDQPFTGGELTRIIKPPQQTFPWARFITTEGWVAAVGDDDWGLGVCNPTVYTYLGGTNTPKKTWASDAGPTMYISPVSTDALDHNIVFDFDMIIRAGKLTSLREYFCGMMAKRSPPVWTFAKDRQHWVPRGCVDAGWPIQDGLKLTLTKGKQASIEGPVHPYPAASATKLRITGTWSGLAGNGHISWKKQGGNPTPKPNSIPFPIPATGNETSIEVDLGSAPGYDGLITQLTLWPADQPNAEGHVTVKSIELINTNLAKP